MAAVAQHSKASVARTAHSHPHPMLPGTPGRNVAASAARHTANAPANTRSNLADTQLP